MKKLFQKLTSTIAKDSTINLEAKVTKTAEIKFDRGQP